MKTSLILTLMLSGVAVAAGPANAETRRKCDVDSNRLSGSIFLIAPDGRFCEASAEDERRHAEELDASLKAAEEQAEAERAAQLARFKAETRRSMVEGGAITVEADRAIAQALQAGKQAEAAARPATRPARAATRPTGPGGSGKCMGKSGKDGTPCVPVPNMSGIGNAIASRGLGY